MRTNINLPDDLHAEFRKRCEAMGFTMAEVIQAYIAIELSEPIIMAKKREAAEPMLRNPEAARSAYAAQLARNQEIVRRVQAGEFLYEIAEAYGLSISGVSRIVSRASERASA